jgi:hypothetical protein
MTRLAAKYTDFGAEDAIADGRAEASRMGLATRNRKTGGKGKPAGSSP